jgi:hypothetical protein
MGATGISVNQLSGMPDKSLGWNSSQATQRTWRICGGDMAGMRADAVVCSAACRAEASRLRRLLSGSDADGYQSLTERLDARRRRTRVATTALAAQRELRSGDQVIEGEAEEETDA